ncbi:hypothetical protein CAPTEDRAFT_214126 [Capitella teleta]|uniref:Annexin n=1 Tax=Capitella teleta TaxID=283909 RepID=R7TSZ4_CAPTE|nr:hypothetical protein CAPTEDRAFT_214126 [Capitella teleta]|eukprot:ELT94150.1 hypothetical protein CAPTEDRAFT_214126 [Capitella teleta]
MKGIGTDEATVIDIITSRSNAQRQTLKKIYHETYKQDLDKELESELSGDFEELIIGLMTPAATYDAQCLRDSMKGVGTRETGLIGILASKNSQEMAEVKTEYKKKYKKDLTADIQSKTSGDLRVVLLELIKADRDPGNAVDRNLAREDAKKLNKLTGKSLVDGIEDGMSGSTADAYIAIAQSTDPVGFHAKQLYNSMDGLGTNDSMLIRTIVGRSELDLGDIKAKYKSLYGKKLENEVSSETSGDYRRALLAVLKDK